MQSFPNLSSSSHLKIVKDSSLQANELFFDSSDNRQKIHPIPIIYSKLQQKQYESKFNKTFHLRGYKYISKLAAVGHQTDENLRKIKKSSLKMTRSIEFDAYLCDSSGLKPLTEVIKKLKTSITAVNLTIRRAKNSKEVIDLSHCLGRMRRLRKFRLEFSSSVKLEEVAKKTMRRELKKCYMLKTIEIRLVSVQNTGQRDFRGFAHVYGRLLKLDEVKHQVYTNNTPQNEYKDLPKHVLKLAGNECSRILVYLIERTSMTDGAGQFLPSLLRSFPKRVSPIEHAHIFNNFAISTEAVEELVKILPQLLDLRIFFVEFANCKLGDLELMVLADGFTHCKQIEHLNFKFLERTPISLEYICEFVRIIAELSSFSSFELYFRKLKYSEEEGRGLREMFSGIANIEYIFTKESLHVYRRKRSKEEQQC